MPVAAAVIPLTSRSASGLPLCTKSMYTVQGAYGASLGGPSMTSPPGNSPCLRASLRASLRCCASTGLFPMLAWCIHQPSNSSTRHETRLIPSPPVLNYHPTVPHSTGAGRRPCCRASIRRPLGLGPGLVTHFKRQSKLLHIVLGTTQPVSDPSVLGRPSKGDARQSWHRLHTQHHPAT